MADHPGGPKKAFQNDDFLHSKDARSLRILSEYLEPQARFDDQQVRDTVVFFGSARTLSREEAEKRLKAAKKNGGEMAARGRAMWKTPNGT